MGTARHGTARRASRQFRHASSGVGVSELCSSHAAFAVVAEARAVAPDGDHRGRRGATTWHMVPFRKTCHEGRKRGGRAPSRDDEGTRRSGGERRKRRAAPGLQTQPEEPVAASCGPVKTATLAMPRDLRWREGAEEAHREGAAGASAVALAWLGACDGGQTRRTKPSFGGAWLEGHGPSVASGSDAAESVSFGGAWLQGHASHRLGEIEASSVSSLASAEGRLRPSDAALRRRPHRHSDRMLRRQTS